jgi:hypothetical protein
MDDVGVNLVKVDVLLSVWLYWLKISTDGRHQFLKISFIFHKNRDFPELQSDCWLLRVAEVVITDININAVDLDSC